MDWEDRITRLTQLVRRGDDPMHARLRAVLRIRGIDVGTALLANLMPDGPGLTTGLVVTSEGRVYEFDLHDRDRPLEEAELRVWRDVTDADHAHWNQDAVSAARAMLDRGDLARSTAVDPKPAPAHQRGYVTQP